MGEESSRLHARITGLVQGVGFRYFVLEVARPLKLTGWVRNRIDGSVEVLAEGPRGPLENLLVALQQGPRGARVSSVDTQWLPATGEFTAFRITH